MSHMRSYYRVPKRVVMALTAIFSLFLLFGVASFEPSFSSATNTTVVSSKTIDAKALCDHEIDDGEWHFVITQTTSGEAPKTIRVTWDNGDVADVPLAKVTGGVAHYVTILNLDAHVVSATAVISSSWSGQFNLSHGPACSPIPTTTTSTSAPTTSTTIAPPTTTTKPTTTVVPSTTTLPPTTVVTTTTVPSTTSTLPPTTGKPTTTTAPSTTVPGTTSTTGVITTPPSTSTPDTTSPPVVTVPPTSTPPVGTTTPPPTLPVTGSDLRLLGYAMILVGLGTAMLLLRVILDNRQKV